MVQTMNGELNAVKSREFIFEIYLYYVKEDLKRCFGKWERNVSLSDIQIGAKIAVNRFNVHFQEMPFVKIYILFVDALREFYLFLYKKKEAKSNVERNCCISKQIE